MRADFTHVRLGCDLIALVATMGNSRATFVKFSTREDAATLCVERGAARVERLGKSHITLALGHRPVMAGHKMGFLAADSGRKVPGTQRLRPSLSCTAGRFDHTRPQTTD
jgi:tryptophan synthase beta subunit